MDIYRSKINPSVWGVFVNDYKTSSILIPLPTQARAYIETGNSTIESFIPAPDKTKIILSATSIYNDTSGAFPVSKQIHYQQKNSITSSVTVTAGVNSNSNFSLNLGQAPVVGTIGTTIGLSLSVSKQTFVIKEDEFSITDQVTPTVPPNKKLYIYAVQKIQQGSMKYSVPVTFTGDVVTKQFPKSHILAPAYHLQEEKSKVQKGTFFIFCNILTFLLFAIMNIFFESTKSVVHPPHSYQCIDSWIYMSATTLRRPIWESNVGTPIVSTQFR